MAGTDEDFWEDLLGHLKQGVLVPVVGPELLVVPDPHRRLTLSRALGERLADRYGLTVGWGEQGGLSEAVQTFLATRGPSEGERLYRVVNDLLAELDPKPPDALQQLAAIGDFRLFVSTTFDSLLARALDAVRFGGERCTRQLWFSPNQSTADQQRNAIAPAADESVVFKLFGQASSTPQYAIHDEDLLEWLHALLSEAARLPEWLAHEFKEDPLLFIGCDIPDWMGRLLIRLGSRTRLSLAHKQFFIVGNRIAVPSQLSLFLRTYCGTTRVQVLDADPSDFVVELNRRWQERNPQRPDAGPGGARPLKGSIFISYVREDAEAARRLEAALAALGGDVWLDQRRLQPGDEWEEEILTAIKREVGLFLPIISNQTERRQEGYVFKEWKAAVDRAAGMLNRHFILPVVVDADYDGNPDRYRQVPEAFRQFQFGRAPGGAPTPDLATAVTNEIRVMRRPEMP